MALSLRHVVFIAFSVLSVMYGYSANAAGETRYSSSRIEFRDDTGAWRSTNIGNGNGGSLGSSCSTAGLVAYDTTSDRLEFCNGSSWRHMNAGNSGVACTSSSQEGRVRYSATGNGFLEFCNGSNQWRRTYAGLAGCSTSTASNCVRTATSHGGSSGSCTASGSCSYTCSNGSWVLSSNTCSSGTASCMVDRTYQGAYECVHGSGTHGENKTGSCLSSSGNCNVTCNNGTWDINWFSCSGVPF